MKVLFGYAYGHTQWKGKPVNGILLEVARLPRVGEWVQVIIDGVEVISGPVNGVRSDYMKDGSRPVAEYVTVAVAKDDCPPDGDEV